MLALIGLCWRTVDAFHLGDPDAPRLFAGLRARADILGCQSVLYIVEAIGVMLAIRSGRLDEAEAKAHACVELGTRIGDADALGFLGAHLITIRWIQGRDAELLGTVEQIATSPTLNPGDFSCFESDDTSLCNRTYAGLRRVAQRFPALEITLVAQTYGLFDKMAPPPPGLEAEQFQRAWLTERHLPGALAVTSTPFWRLPAPDRRRINRDVPNVVQYSFGRTWHVPNWIFPPFLIDQDGTIVETAFRSFDADLPEMIAVLLARQVTPPQSGRDR